MNKTITIALSILTFGLTLSTTALAEPFNHGSGYVDAISNAYSNSSTQGVQSVRHTETMVTLNGFNDRDTVEGENITVGSRAAAKMSISKTLSVITGGFNDRS